jgi:hypothetical protein
MVDEIVEIQKEIDNALGASLPREESPEGWICIDPINPLMRKGIDKKVLELDKKKTRMLKELVDFHKVRSRFKQYYVWSGSKRTGEAAEAMARAVMGSFRRSLRRLGESTQWILAAQAHTGGTYLVDLATVKSAQPWPVSPLPDDGELFVDVESKGMFDLDPFGKHSDFAGPTPHLTLYGKTLVECFDQCGVDFWQRVGNG